MDILIEHAGHLCFLDGRDFAVWKHDEYAHIFLPTQAVDRGAPSVTTGGTDDCEMMTRLALRQRLVAADKEKFKEIAEELEGYVFEGEGWSVEEFKQVEVFGRVQGDERDCVRVAEDGVASVDDIFELFV